MSGFAMRARVPASSANLGPGFDALALALDLHVEVEVTPSDRPRLVKEGEGADLDIADEEHLAVEVVRRVTGHDSHAITVRSEIPVSRGLGSSASLALAAAAAAGADDPLAVAADVDGHPENAGASFLGGFVTATTLGGRPIVERLPLDDDLVFVAVVPERTLATKDARAALPDSVGFADAAFNVGRAGLLIAGMADARRLRREAFDDRLHQPHRTPLFPESAALLAGLVDAGALGSCWSGAGPTMLGVCTREAAARVAEAAGRLLLEQQVAGAVRVLEADRRGLVVG
ncbi:MAG TPA: homoserine kinase [Acidimicrobiales bacterium]|nr:homoserine kinase [Acidimicrobiales bacterium]